MVVSKKELQCSYSSVDEVIVSEISFKCGLVLPLISVSFFLKSIFFYNVFFYPFDVGDVFIISRKQKM